MGDSVGNFEGAGGAAASGETAMLAGETAETAPESSFRSAIDAPIGTRVLAREASGCDVQSVRRLSDCGPPGGRSGCDDKNLSGVPVPEFS
jgi:hypothetical protein